MPASWRYRESVGRVAIAKLSIVRVGEWGGIVQAKMVALKHLFQFPAAARD